MMQRPQPSTGFTLIEALVYISILGIVSTGAITLLFNLDELFFQYRLQQQLFASGTATIDRVLTELRQAETIDLMASELATSTIGVLVLESGATTTELVLDEDNLLVTVNGTTEGTLNPTNVVVDGFTVFHYPLSNGELVRVRLALTATQGEYTFQEVFYGAATIRGAYD